MVHGHEHKVETETADRIAVLCVWLRCSSVSLFAIYTFCWRGILASLQIASSPRRNRQCGRDRCLLLGVFSRCNINTGCIRCSARAVNSEAQEKKTNRKNVTIGLLESSWSIDGRYLNSWAAALIMSSHNRNTTTATIKLRVKISVFCWYNIRNIIAKNI